MRHVFKLRSVLLGEHIHTTVFSGNEGQTLANTGTLVMRMGEWQLFGAILKLGSECNNAIKAHALVILEGGKEIVEREVKDEAINDLLTDPVLEDRGDNLG